ncbi:hypothetical protein DPMN_173132 [Dreissena polymorpha]|uniref:Uncharacterized protein n=1 Tax=Dreissena polymorpha TaxID=45954 RepID=A0A9D4E2A5_DREPO|nr:hypothetical protein DPMN_173132 [Dreissena polymorpha]
MPEVCRSSRKLPSGPRSKEPLLPDSGMQRTHASAPVHAWPDSVTPYTTTECVRL